jgi:prolipoprotein diacylglyceryltransferase
VWVLFALGRLGRFRQGSGALLFLALGLWSSVRIVVGFTWRDDAALGPFSVEQALALVVLIVATLGLLLPGRRVSPATSGVPPEVQAA